MMRRHTYGPVPSRRLGRSLGVDLVPLKTCDFNCVYCQLGPTPRTTLKRADYVPVGELAEEVRARLAEGPRPDYVTLSGSGEPTLHSSFGEVAAAIKEIADVPVALLTNGSLFWLPEVRSACRAVDLVLPSLDAGEEETFRRVNRPHPDLRFEAVLDGLVRLRDEYEGQMWLEVFVVEGVNSSDGQVERIRDCIERIQPDRVQLNTAVRPPAEQDVRPATAGRLEQIRSLLGPRAEIVCQGAAFERTPGAEARKEQVLEMLRRRPCTVQDVADGLAIHPNEAIKHVQRLLDERLVRRRRQGARTYYEATQ